MSHFCWATHIRTTLAAVHFEYPTLKMHVPRWQLANQRRVSSDERLGESQSRFSHWIFRNSSPSKRLYHLFPLPVSTTISQQPPHGKSNTEWSTKTPALTTAASHQLLSAQVHVACGKSHTALRCNIGPESSVNMASVGKGKNGNNNGHFFKKYKPKWYLLVSCQEGFIIFNWPWDLLKLEIRNNTNPTSPSSQVAFGKVLDDPSCPDCLSPTWLIAPSMACLSKCCQPPSGTSAARSYPSAPRKPRANSVTTVFSLKSLLRVSVFRRFGDMIGFTL